MSPETHLFWDQKVKGQGHEAQKNSIGVGVWTLVIASPGSLVICPLYQWRAVSVTCHRV